MDYDEIPDQPIGLIAEMAQEQRPREKALTHGIKSLSDSELMALIFATGIKGKGVVAMCDDILADNDGHLSLIAEMDAAEFMNRYKGIGPAKALTLLAALELGTRSVADAAKCASRTITSADMAAKYMAPHLAHLDHEEFWVLLLKQNLTPIRAVRIGVGGTNATLVDVKIIMRQAIMAKASAMMLFHNHPSGALTPSIPDINLTNKITEAAKLMDIRVTDHIIIGRGHHYSFHENGKM